MAHGQPDFGMYGKKETVFGLADMAELVARLGSIVTFDRRGNVICLDSFETPSITWGQTTGGAGGSIQVSSLTARSGQQSIKITPPTAIDTPAMISKGFAIPVASKLGFEFSFAIPSENLDLQFIVMLYDGTEYHEAYLSYVRSGSSGTFRYTDGTWHTLESLRLLESIYCFHTLKVVIDYLNGKYLRVHLDDNVYDLAGVDLVSEPDLTAPYVSVSILVYRKSGGVSAPFAYIDDFIYTQNEE